MIYLNMIQKKKTLIEKFDSKTIASGMKSQVHSTTQSDSDNRLQGASHTTQVFCRKNIDDKKEDIDNRLKVSNKGYASQRKRIEFRPDEEQSMSDFSKYNPFFLALAVLNFFIQIIGEILSIFTWLIKETFNWTYDMIVPRNMLNKLGIKVGTKYCVNKIYWRYFLTLLCPPAGVFMAYGFSGWVQLIICCILSLLYYIPGLVYAIIVMNRSDIAEHIETSLFGSCQDVPTKLFISDKDNEPKCGRVAGEKCYVNGGLPVPNNPNVKSCCLQPVYNPDDQRWYRGESIALNPKGEEISTYEEGELMCKPVKFNFFKTEEGAGVCVFKSTGRPST